jgi:hypothetical protein
MVKTSEEDSSDDLVLKNVGNATISSTSLPPENVPSMIVPTKDGPARVPSEVLPVKILVHSSVDMVKASEEDSSKDLFLKNVSNATTSSMSFPPENVPGDTINVPATTSGLYILHQAAAFATRDTTETLNFEGRDKNEKDRDKMFDRDVNETFGGHSPTHALSKETGSVSQPRDFNAIAAVVQEEIRFKDTAVLLEK